MKNLQTGCWITVALALLLTPGRCSADSASVSVSAPGTVTQGSSFAVDVSIANAADIFDYELDLTFNPAVLQASAVVEGAFLSDSGATFFIPGVIDNVGGTVSFNADTLLTSVSGVNGSGLLLIIDFSAFNTGTSSLGIQNLILQDSLGNIVDGSVKNGSVAVTAPVGVPESSSLTLLALGFAALMMTRLKRAFRSESQCRSRAPVAG